MAQGGLQSELVAFVFVHGYKVELTMSTVWGEDEQDFSLTVSFESFEERGSFLSALSSAREQWNNGNFVASAGLVAAAVLTENADAQADADAGTVPAAPAAAGGEAPVAVGNVLRVLAAAKVRTSSALDSEQVGMLLVDERILVLEVATLSLTVEIKHESEEDEDEDVSDSSGEGVNDEFDVDRPAAAAAGVRNTRVVRRHRVRFHRGWASVRASDGEPSAAYMIFY